MLNLKSTVSEEGKYVTQIIHFKDGSKRTFHGIDTESIKQGQFTKMRLKNGTLLLVHDENVNCIEVIPEK
jgi:predicted transcriptional regulator